MAVIEVPDRHLDAVLNLVSRLDSKAASEAKRAEYLETTPYEDRLRSFLDGFKGNKPRSSEIELVTRDEATSNKFWNPLVYDLRIGSSSWDRYFLSSELVPVVARWSRLGRIARSRVYNVMGRTVWAERLHIRWIRFVYGTTKPTFLTVAEWREWYNDADIEHRINAKLRSRDCELYHDRSWGSAFGWIHGGGIYDSRGSCLTPRPSKDNRQGGHHNVIISGKSYTVSNSAFSWIKNLRSKESKLEKLSKRLELSRKRAA